MTVPLSAIKADPDAVLPPTSMPIPLEVPSNHQLQRPQRDGYDMKQNTADTAATSTNNSTNNNNDNVGGGVYAGATVATMKLPSVTSQTTKVIRSLLGSDQCCNNNEIPAKYQLPRCKMPSPSEMAPVETFVYNAIMSQEPRVVDTNNNNTTNTASSKPDTASNSGAVYPDPAHIQGYRCIIDALKRPNDPPMLHKVLIALRTAGHGTALNKLVLGNNHAQLVHLIIRFVSTRIPDRFEETASGNPEVLLKVYDDYSLCEAHFNLLLAMVSAKSTHVVPVMSAVWKLLTRFGPLDDKGLTQRLHAMLFNIMRLVPKSNSDLYPIIASRFPFFTWEKERLVWYTEQCFRVLDYLPFLRSRFLELLIDKCLEIDVNIFIKDNGDVAIDEVEQGNKDKEEVTENKHAEDDTTMKDDVSNNRLDPVDVLSDKLDALLELLFQHISSRCKNGVNVARQTYYELIPIFERSILTTHKSKFVQYCMFLSCGLETQYEGKIKNPDTNYDDGIELSHVVTPDSLDEEGSILHREFASKLLDVIVDPYRATTTRQSAACYLASFISRASFVGPDTVCESVSALLRWAEAYIESLGVHAVRAADAREQSDFHALFYTVCQAAFYIMCFRGHEAIQFFRKAVGNHNSPEKADGMGAGGIMDETHDELLYSDVECINLASERWTFLCGHELQPLRFCLESVRSEFLNVAHFFNLIEEKVLDKLIADAKRISTGKVNKKAASAISTAATLERRRQTGGVGGLGRGSNPLKSFFPFDPLLLRHSHEYVAPFYKYWQGPVEEDDILVIDEVKHDDVEPIFEMDEAMDALDRAEDDYDDDESDENEEDDDDDSEEESVNEDSEAVSDPQRNQGGPIYGTPDAYHHKILQQKAWTETLKRPRSQSMENGSW